MADYVSSLTGVAMDMALQDMAEHNSEAWAVGQRNGNPVTSDDVTYHNNAQYYAQQAQSIAPASVTEAVRWDIAQTALTDADRALARANIDAGKNGAWSNRNLLDNAYFVGGGSQLGDGVFPINQRGQSSYSGGYGIDRWRCWQVSTTTLTASGLTFATGANADGLFQYFTRAFWESLYGKTVTVSAIINGQLYSATGVASADCWIANNFDGNNYFGYICNGNDANFRVLLEGANRSVTIQAAKLELGTVSTLANDVPPDFGAELRKCQRYFMRITAKNGTRGYAGIGSANNSKNMLCLVPMPVVMRATPNVSFSNCNCYNFVSGGSIPISAISLDSWSENGVFVSCTPSDISQVVQYQPYALRIASGGYVQFSAEL